MTKIVDPKGKMARAKAKMSSKCSVRLSPYCDDIISLRFQGKSYRAIEDFLREKGLEFVIPAATLWRNLMRGMGDETSFLPVYEEIAEEHGGEISVDAGRVMAGQALIQRLRIDYMVRMEGVRRKNRPGYTNPRIRQEMETYLQLVEAAVKFDPAHNRGIDDIGKGQVALTPEAEEAMSLLILSGGISLPNLVNKKPFLKIVGSNG